MIRGTGTKLENETVILFNEAEDDAVISTSSPTVYRRLVKRGWTPNKEYENRAVFVLPRGRVRLPVQQRRRSSSTLAPTRGFQSKTANVVGPDGRGLCRA